MWTSLEISQKVLPSNRGALFYSLFLLLFLFSATSAVWAQVSWAAGDLPKLAQAGGADAERTTAVLQEGPVVAKGLDFLGPNVISHHYATYRYNDREVGVFYVQTSIVAFESSGRFACGGLLFQELENTLDDIYYHRSREGFSLFFRFPYGTGLDCDFAEVFINRFNFFLRSKEGKPGIPFPAILRLR